jgi:hypothetical protein
MGWWTTNIGMSVKELEEPLHQSQAMGNPQIFLHINSKKLEYNGVANLNSKESWLGPGCDESAPSLSSGVLDFHVRWCS